MKFILGKKIGMTQMFDANGVQTPVTLVSAGPCYVLQEKTIAKDGYEASQIGFEKIEKKNKITKTMKGKEYRYIKEARLADQATAKGDTKMETPVGESFTVEIFKEGEEVKVSGISKGKGFQGGRKRHGFRGKLSTTHGNRSGGPRQIGSVGRRFPQHVAKGKKMPGRMGAERISVKNLKIMKVDVANNLLVVKGAVPGRPGILLEIRA